MSVTDALLVMQFVEESTVMYNVKWTADQWPETNHVRDWGHESDFQFDDEGEYGDDMPF